MLSGLTAISSQLLRELNLYDLIDAQRAMYLHAGSAMRETEGNVALSWGRIAGSSNDAKLALYKTQSQQIFNQMKQLDEDYYNRAIPEIYRKGLSQGSGRQVELTTADWNRLRPIRKEGLDEMARARGATQIDINRQIKALDELHGGPVQARKQVVKNPVTAKVYKDGRHYSYDGYSDMLVNTRSQQVFNMATLQGGENEGVLLYMVSDGPGCGWNYHDDPEGANGKIVTRDEALAHLIAHPNCRREFIPRPDLKKKPKGGRSSAKAVAAAVAGTGALVSSGVVVAANRSLVSALVNTVLGSAENISLADRIRGYTLVVNAENENLSKLIPFPEGAGGEVTEMNVIDDITVNGEGWAINQNAELPGHVRYMLGLADDASEDEIGRALQKFDNFQEARKLKVIDPEQADAWLEFKDDKAVEFWQGREDYAAMRLSLPKVGGSHVPRLAHATKWVKVQGTLTDQFKYMDEDAIRYYARAQGLKLSKGADGALKTRAELVEELGGYKPGILSRFTINPHGVARLGFGIDPATGAVTPNFRYVPRGPVRFATELSQPRKRTKEEVIKLARRKGYRQALDPENLKYQEIDFAGKTRAEILLRIGQSDDLIRNVDTNVRFILPFKTFNQELNFKNFELQSVVTDIRLFSGRLVGNVRWKDGVISTSGNLKLLKNQEWLRTNLRLGYRFGENGIEQTRAQLNLGAGRAFDRLTDAIDLLTAQWIPFPERVKKELQILNGGVFQIANTLKINWKDAQRLVVRAEENFFEFLAERRSMDVPKVTQLAARRIEHQRSKLINPDGLMSKFYSWDAPPARFAARFQEFRDLADAGQIDHAFVDDLQKTIRFMDQMFPGEVGPSDFKLVDYGPDGWSAIKGGGQSGEYNYVHNTISIQKDAAASWSQQFTQFFRSQIEQRAINPDYSGNPSSMLVHEYGHYFHGQMSKKEQRELFNKIIDSWADSWDKPGDSMPWDFGDKEQLFNRGDRRHPYEIMEEFMMRPQNRAFITKKVGEYASRNPQELVAELFSGYFTGPNPSTMSKAVGEQMLRRFGESPKRLIQFGDSRRLIPNGAIPLPPTSSPFGAFLQHELEDIPEGRSVFEHWLRKLEGQVNPINSSWRSGVPLQEVSSAEGVLNIDGAMLYTGQDLHPTLGEHLAILGHAIENRFPFLDHIGINTTNDLLTWGEKLEPNVMDRAYAWTSGADQGKIFRYNTRLVDHSSITMNTDLFSGKYGLPGGDKIVTLDEELGFSSAVNWHPPTIDPDTAGISVMTHEIGHNMWRQMWLDDYPVARQMVKNIEASLSDQFMTDVHLLEEIPGSIIHETVDVLDINNITRENADKLGVSFGDLAQWNHQARAAITNGLSEYGSQDVQEMMAEAMAEHMHSSSPRELSRLIGDTFERYYQGKIDLTEPSFRLQAVDTIPVRTVNDLPEDIVDLADIGFDLHPELDRWMANLTDDEMDFLNSENTGIKMVLSTDSIRSTAATTAKSQDIARWAREGGFVPDVPNLDIVVLRTDGEYVVLRGEDKLAAARLTGAPNVQVSLFNNDVNEFKTGFLSRNWIRAQELAKQLGLPVNTGQQRVRWEATVKDTKAAIQVIEKKISEAEATLRHGGLDGADLINKTDELKLNRIALTDTKGRLAVAEQALRDTATWAQASVASAGGV